MVMKHALVGGAPLRTPDEVSDPEERSRLVLMARLTSGANWAVNLATEFLCLPRHWSIEYKSRPGFTFIISIIRKNERERERESDPQGNTTMIPLYDAQHGVISGPSETDPPHDAMYVAFTCQTIQEILIRSDNEKCLASHQ